MYIDGQVLHRFAKSLWGFNRSITGDGVRNTLKEIKAIIPNLEIYEVPSGTKVFDWTVPKEWHVKEAYIIDPDGQKICDFKENNLHLVGYSHSVNKSVPLEELQCNLHSLPDQPSAIPYVTSYYSKNWGFCISHIQREKLKQGNYKVFIDSELFDGNLTYGELIIEGESKKEIFISSYICHPSMANNELSGPVVSTHIAKSILLKKNIYYTYRFVFIPETIGSITYLSQNLEKLKKNIFAGFNLTCIGDERNYSYLPSRMGNSISDKVIKHVLSFVDPNYKSFDWSERGSDERQYCAPGIDLPVASIMRTKYGEYPEYHTSLDNLDNVVTPDGLFGGFKVVDKCLNLLENDGYPITKVLCEPQLGKRGLYPTLSAKKDYQKTNLIMDFLTWSDGKKSILEISDYLNQPMWKILEIVRKLEESELIEIKK